MAACEIEILLDNPDLTYVAGSDIVGRLRIQVFDSCRCKALWLRLFWSTMGEGNEEQGVPEARPLFQGVWLKDRTYDYPFRIPAPKAPLSYNGKLLNVVWHLQSKVELEQQKMGLGAEEFIWIRPGSPVAGIHVHQDLFRWRESKLEAGILVILILTSIVVSVVILNALGLTYLGFLLDISAISAIPAAFLFVRRAVGNRLALHRLGAVRVDFLTTRVRAGGPLEMTVYFRPRRPIELNGLTAVLKAEERIVQGKNFRKLSTWTVFQEERLLQDKCVLAADQLMRIKAEWTLPSDAPTTFRAKDNELRWFVELHADIENWPDWVRDLPLQVLPPKQIITGKF